jgi:hypothetical protein
MDFQQIINKIEETRTELLVILANMNGNDLYKQKDLESWSISQVCQHLYITEELYVVAIRKGLKSKEDSFIANKPVERLLDRRNKLEAPEIAKPSNEVLEYQVIIENLNNSRQKLHELLSTIEDSSVLSRRYFVHPVFKEMLLIEWLESLYIHEQRHIQQIKEIIDERKG